MVYVRTAAAADTTIAATAAACIPTLSLALFAQRMLHVQLPNVLPGVVDEYVAVQDVPQGRQVDVICEEPQLPVLRVGHHAA